MLHTNFLFRPRVAIGISLVTGMIVLTGCAQDRPASYYDTPYDSTLADAQQQAQGRRGTRAPSQLQFGFGDTEAERRATQAQAQTPSDTGANADDQQGTVPAATADRPLREPKTFLGTVPCLTGDAGCPASRITLTLAPSGEWRSRTTRVDVPATEQPIVQQGCWNVIGSDPLRIVLQTPEQDSSISFTFVNDNVLRINLYNDIRPMLDYHLTRQADIDPIDELTDRPALACD